MANERFKRTPTSSGNRSTHTWSGWIKRNVLGDWTRLFSTAGQTLLQLTGSSPPDQIRYLDQTGSNYDLRSTSLFRDIGNWMHIVLSVDHTLSVPRDRVRIYVNGAELDNYSTDSTSNGSQNLRTYFNSITEHGLLGRETVNAGENFKGEAFDIFWIDGQALTPDVFGFYKDGEGYQSSGSSHTTDFRPGQWSPHSPRKIKSDIERRGGFGVNGFYLPMNDSSNPGADFHMTPNSIITLKGEDLPQPRNGAPTTSDSYVSQLRQETGTLGFDGCIKVDSYGGLVVPDHSDLDLGTSDFTVEGFYYIDDSNVSTGYHALFDFRGTSGANGQYLAMFRHPNGHIYLYVDGAIRINNVGFTTNKWTHVALSRSSGTTRLFVDGVEQGSFSDSFNYVSRELKIGHSATQSNPMRGFISNFRVVKGTAVYTSNFTKPTQPLENINNTIVLMAQSATSATAGVAPAAIATYTYNGNSVVFATRNELTGSIVLAIPGITGGQSSGHGDYSADIRGTGSNKTVTSDVETTVTSFSSFYGSALVFDRFDGNFLSIANNSDFNYSGGEDFTVELWYYRQVTNTNEALIGVFENSTARRAWQLEARANAGLRFEWWSNGSSGTSIDSGNDTVPVNQWHHLCVERSGDTITLYVNGVAFNLDTTAGSIYNNTTDPLRIGMLNTAQDQLLTGMLQDIRVYKGVAKYKGGFDVPKPYTPVGIEAFRTVTDTCKNNFATLNPLSYQTTGTYGTSYPVLTDGNLRFTHGQTGQWERSNCTMGASEGKWYFEFKKVAGAGLSGSYENWAVGVRESDGSLFYGETDGFEDLGDHVYWLDGGTARIVSNQDRNAGATDGISDVVNGDIINIAFEKTATNLKVWFGKNGTYFNSGNPATGANPAVNHSTTTEYIIPSVAFYQYAGQTEPVGVLNFGQNPSFSGTTTAGTNADDSGKGLFKYALPSGFLALCEDNLPTPAIADPGKQFKTMLYRGDTNRGHKITDVGFQPDLVWIKNRTTATSHGLYDIIRGPEYDLRSDSTAASAQYSGYGVASFDEDGFTVQGNGTVSNSADNFVAWCWKAGGPAVPNSDGTLTSQVSVNQTAGFSIVQFTGQGGSSSATVGHGLGKKPAFWIYKPHTNTTGWYMYHQSLGASAWLQFTTGAATTSNPAAWGGVEPTSTVLTHGSGLVNQGSCILYAWAEIEGYSKFGSFEGNDSTDGAFVYLGFKPALVIAKQVDTVYTVGGSAATSWGMWDSSRMPNNPAGNPLWANLNDTETTRGNGSSANTGGSDGNDLGGFLMCDLLSNGFKARSAGSEFNSGGTHIYMAWAESPFKTANAK